MKNKIIKYFFQFFLILFISNAACVPTSVNLPIAEDVKNNFLYATAIANIVAAGDSSNNSCTIAYNYCTAVAFFRSKGKYHFFTAAHCVAKYNQKTSETVPKELAVQLILEKQNGEKWAYEAKVMTIGEIKNFEDLAVLEMETSDNIPIMPLSELDLERGEKIFGITAPVGSGIGFLQIEGYISKEKINGLTVNGNVEVDSAFVVQLNGLGSGEGFSGGGIFSSKHNAIVGIPVTSFSINGHTSILVIPIAKFNNFYKEYLEGKRPLLKKEPNQCILKK